MKMTLKLTAAVFAGLFLALTSAFFGINADAAVFIEGKAPTAEADKKARQMFSSLSQRDLKDMNLSADAELGAGFIPYTFDDDGKLKPFDKFEMYYYPIVSGDDIEGLMQIHRTESAENLSYQVGGYPFMTDLNDKGSSLNDPIIVIVSENTYAYMNKKLICEANLPIYDKEKYTKEKFALESGAIKYSKRDYNIAVESTEKLSENIAGAEDDFYSLNGKIYKIENGKFARGWRRHGKYTYYFGKNGSAVTGKVKIGGKKYRFSDKGVLLKSGT